MSITIRPTLSVIFQSVAFTLLLAIVSGWWPIFTVIAFILIELIYLVPFYWDIEGDRLRKPFCSGYGKGCLLGTLACLMMLSLRILLEISLRGHFISGIFICLLVCLPVCLMMGYLLTTLFSSLSPRPTYLCLSTLLLLNLGFYLSSLIVYHWFSLDPFDDYLHYLMSQKFHYDYLTGRAPELGQRQEVVFICLWALTALVLYFQYETITFGRLGKKQASVLPDAKRLAWGIAFALVCIVGTAVGFAYYKVTSDDYYIDPGILPPLYVPRHLWLYLMGGLLSVAGMVLVYAKRLKDEPRKIAIREQKLREENRRDYLKKEQEKREHEAKIAQYLQKFDVGKPSETIIFVPFGYLNDFSNYIFFFEKEQTVIFLDKKYAYSDIVDCSISTYTQKIGEDRAVTRYNRGDVWSGALIGEMIGGRTGAIIGATTANTVTTYISAQTYTSYHLTLTVNDPQTPFIKVQVTPFNLDKVVNAFNRIVIRNIARL